MADGISPLKTLWTFCVREVGEGEISILRILHPLVFLPLACETGEREFSSSVLLRPHLGKGWPKEESC